jgi:HD-like signal output (HDOD) protein
MTAAASFTIRPAPKAYTPSEITTRVRMCPRLPSLRSIQGALRELLAAEQRFAGQISEVIRRDPGLTARLLRLVNSAHFGLSHKVTNLEEAVFYVGVRQVRELATMTPVIDDFKRLAGPKGGAWRDLWKHSIASAMVTKELMLATPEPGDDLDYVAGLVHDVGWIVLGTVFPDHYHEILNRLTEGTSSARHIETDVLGCDHAQLGAIYLKTQELGATLIQATSFHHTPAGAENYARLAAAVQIADNFTISIGLGHPGDVVKGGPSWQEVSGWSLLFPSELESNKKFAIKTLERMGERLPGMVDCLV